MIRKSRKVAGWSGESGGEREKANTPETGAVESRVTVGDGEERVFVSLTALGGTAGRRFRFFFLRGELAAPRRA